MHKSKEEMVAEEVINITNKLQARTGEMVEGLPVAKTDDRPDYVKDFEAKHFDNPKSPLYGNRQAVLIAMAAAGLDTEEVELRQTHVTPLPVQRGTVVVLVDSKLYTWPKEGDTTAGLVLVNTGDTYRGERTGATRSGTPHYRTFTDEKVRNLILNSSNARYATDKEIATFVKAAIAAQPMKFIRALGNAKEFENLD